MPSNPGPAYILNVTDVTYGEWSINEAILINRKTHPKPPTLPSLKLKAPTWKLVAKEDDFLFVRCPRPISRGQLAVSFQGNPIPKGCPNVRCQTLEEPVVTWGRQEKGRGPQVESSETHSYFQSGELFSSHPKSHVLHQFMTLLCVHVVSDGFTGLIPKVRVKPFAWPMIQPRIFPLNSSAGNGFTNSKPRNQSHLP